MKCFFIVVLMHLSIGFASAQNILISGKVCNSNTKETLPFVHIRVKGTNIGTISNIEGKFELSIQNKHKKDTLVFSSIGYTSKESVASVFVNEITIFLDPYVRNLEEVKIEAKRFNPMSVLDKALLNLDTNRHLDKYSANLFTRNYISFDNSFVFYRQTLYETQPFDDELTEWIRGNRIADKVIVNDGARRMHRSTSTNWALFLFRDWLSRGDSKNSKDYKFKKPIAHLEDIILQDNRKIYVLDVYEDYTDPEILDNIYSILDKAKSPYSLMFDPASQQMGESFFYNRKTVFFRYYIDASQNYNIIRKQKLFSSLGGLFLFVTVDYSNDTGRSTPKHYIGFKSNLQGNYQGRKVFAKSLYEVHSFNEDFENKDSLNFDSSKFINQHLGPAMNAVKGEESVDFDLSDGALTYIKSDSLQERAIQEINYYKTHPFKVNIDSIDFVSRKPWSGNLKRDSLLIKKPELFLGGYVLDSLTQEPLEFCNVVAKNIEDTLAPILGAMTNQEGYFEIELPPVYNNYQFTFSYVGFKSQTYKITAQDLFGNLPLEEFVSAYPIKAYGELSNVINMSVDKTLLKGVEIKASAYRMDIDKQKVVITKEMKDNTIVAKDLLNKINGLSYDRIGKVLRVDGDPNVKVLIDGMDKDRDYILNLNPKRIMRVEILRNISGIYEIQGFTSIINIITYDNYRGVDLLISDSDNRNLKNGQQATRIENSADLSLDIMRNKWNCLLEADAYAEDLSSYIKTTTTYPASQEKYINTHTIDPNLTENYFASKYKLAVDYRPNRKHTVGVEASGSAIPDKYNRKLYSLDSLISGNQVELSENQMTSASEYQHMQGKFFYHYKKNKNTRFTAYTNYSHKNSIDHYDLLGIQSYIEKVRSDKVKSYAEFNTKFGKSINVSTGVFYSQNKDESKRTEGLGSSFLSEFNKASAFTFGTLKISKNSNLRFGTIYTYYQISNDLVGYDFKSFQPQVHFSHMQSKKSKWELDYRVKTQYPGIYALSPQTTFYNSYTTFTGNPDLKPYNYHSAEATYSWLKRDMLQYLTVKPYFNYSGNAPGYVVQIADSLLQYSQDNFVKHTILGVRTNAAFRFHKKVELDCGFNLYQERMANITVDPIFDFTGDAKLTYKLSLKHTLSMMYEKYNAKHISSLGYNKYGSQYLVLSWRGLFLKGKLEMTAGYSLPLGSKLYDENYENTIAYQKHTFIDNSYMQNMLFLSLSYRFSKGNIKRNNLLPTEMDSTEESRGGKRMYND